MELLFIPFLLGDIVSHLKEPQGMTVLISQRPHMAVREEAAPILAHVPARMDARQRDAALAFLILAVLGWIRHRANLKRLANGEEPRIGAKPAEKPARKGKRS